MTDLPTRVDIREVGPRDGLQMAHEIMPTALKTRWIAAIAQAGRNLWFIFMAEQLGVFLTF